MSGHPWIEHDGSGYPVPNGTHVSARLRNGEIYDYIISGKYRGTTNGLMPGCRSIWFWAHQKNRPEVNHSFDAVAYRLSDTDDKAKREARMENFRRMAQPNEFDVRPVKLPQKMGANQ